MDDLTQAASPSAEGLLERLLDEAEATPSPTGALSQASAPSAEISPPGGGEASLASLLTNPAMLTALPVLMENLSPLLSGMGRGVGSAPTVSRSHGTDRHTALLCALKPYLSPRRRETAETVIRLCKVWDALERSGISLTGLLGSVGGAVPTQEGGDGHVQ